MVDVASKENQELVTLTLREDFYRDSFSKLILIVANISVAIILLIAVSLYLYLNKPSPISFFVDAEWRVQPSVPLDQPYLSTADLQQWTSDAIQKSFIYDFYQYNDQLKAAAKYFTPNGWQVFLNQLNIYVNYNNVQTAKMFINATPDRAPVILQQGLLAGRYGWWVQIPVNLNYISYNRSSVQTLMLQILVVRVPTLTNLAGVGIDNVIVTKATGNSLLGNGQ